MREDLEAVCAEGGSYRALGHAGRRAEERRGYVNRKTDCLGPVLMFTPLVPMCWCGCPISVIVQSVLPPFNVLSSPRAQHSQGRQRAAC